MKPKVCVDTHSIIWYFLGKKTLSQKAKKFIRKGFTNKLTLLAPTLVLLEAFHLSLKHPKFIFPEFLKQLKQAKIVLVPFDKKVLHKCYTLPPELDIHDRIIAATALVSNCPLISKDKIFVKQTQLKIIW